MINMGRQTPAAASETPAAKSRPRSPSQPPPARPVLRSRRSVSQSRQSESPPVPWGDSTFAHAARRYVDVARIISVSPDHDRDTDRYSGRGQPKGTGRGKRSPSREMPSIETVRREGVRQEPYEFQGFRLHTVKHVVVTQMDDLQQEAAARGSSSRCSPSKQAERRHSGGKGKRDESRNAEGRRSGQGKSKGNGRDAGPRPSGMDSAYDRPDFGVSSCFVYCWMIWSGFFKISNEALNRIFESELYDKISCELSFILRHSGWTHADKSLTVFELMAGARIRKMLSLWAHTCVAKEEPVFRLCKRLSFRNGANILLRE